MNSNPYSDYGTQLTGDRFLGREKELRLLQDRLFGPNGFGAAAIVGMPRIGKSSLVEQLLYVQKTKGYPEKWCSAKVDCLGLNNVDELRVQLISAIADALNEKSYLTDDLNRRAQSAKANHHELMSFFSALRASKNRVLCILEEFDTSRKIFADSKQMFSQLRSLCSDSQHKTPFLLVAKRRLQEISKAAGLTSHYWANVLLFINLKCFRPHENDAYFVQLASNGVTLSDVQKLQLIDSLGGHPFLMDLFAYHAWNYCVFEKRELNNLAPILQEVRPSMLERFREICVVLEDVDMLAKTRQLFSGGRGRDEVNPDEVDVLVDYGIAVNSQDGAVSCFCNEFSKFLSSNYQDRLQAESNTASASTFSMRQTSKEKTVRIFLASSSELESDRNQFEIYFRRQNDLLRREGMYLEINRWENFLDAMSETRMQDEYNRQITKCDIFLCLFKTKTGKFTEEEFDVAHKNFMSVKSPLIYTYFKDYEISSQTVNVEDLQSLVNFKNRLLKLEHYHTSYKSIEDLINRFRDQLDKLRIEGFI